MPPSEDETPKVVRRSTRNKTTKVVREEQVVSAKKTVTKVKGSKTTKKAPPTAHKEEPLAQPAVTKITGKKKGSGSDKAPKKQPVARKNVSESDSEDSPKKKRATSKKSPPSKVNDKDDKIKSRGKQQQVARKKRSGSESGGEEEGPPKKKKAPAHQILTERDLIPKLWNASEHKESYTFKIGSWNVAGLRALMKRDPDAIGKLIERLNLDILCLQETKLQESHLEDPKVSLPEVTGYDAHYSCSTAKKGYSGTAVFIRKRGATKQKGKQTTMDAFVKSSNQEKEGTSSEDIVPIDMKYLIPDLVSVKMGVNKHDGEGRIIVMDFPLFTAVNVYVPNSGQKLERLDYRTKEWDKDMLAFMQSKQKNRGVPVLWLGDLNVAHTSLEVWNDGAKHLAKQAGVTAEERESFQAQLDAGFVDAFRKLHPDAKGHYSYWSTRAGNRGPNKGLRLDYFVCDPKFFEEDASQVVIRDSYMVEDLEGSDHCPVVLEMEIKKDS